MPHEGPIVVGWDGRPRGQDALALAAAIARQRNTSLVGVYAYYVPVPYHPLPAATIEAVNTAALEECRNLPPDLLAGVEFEPRPVAGESPAHALQHAAEETDAQLVVIGSTHRGSVGRVVPGTVASRLLHGSPCPVAIAPAEYAAHAPESLRVLLVGFDGSDESRSALEAATQIAVEQGATVRVRAVAEDHESGFTTAGAAYSGIDLALERRTYLDEQARVLKERLPAEVRADVRVMGGNPARVLLEEAEQGVDLIVLGSRGYGPILRVLLGSVSEQVVRAAPCPVLVVPSSATRHEPEPAQVAESG